MDPVDSDPPSDIESMCVLLSEMAWTYLNLHDHEAIRSQEKTMVDVDRDRLSTVIGGATLEAQIQKVCAIYLFESSHELLSLSTLLHSEQIAGSLEVLSRAVIERCGRVSWLLDHHPDVTPRIRSARISLEIAVSWQHYREVIDSKYPGSSKASKDATREFREMRTQIEAIFEPIEKKEVVNESGSTIESAEIRFWSLDGTEYPDYTELATWAWFGAEELAKDAKATYKMLCAFSHPSIAASREHQVRVNDYLTYRYEISYINRVVGNAAAAFDRALQSFCSYFDRDFDEVLNGLVGIHDRWPDLPHEVN